MTSIHTWLHDRCSHVYKNKCRGKKKGKTPSQRRNRFLLRVRSESFWKKKGLNPFKASGHICHTFGESCHVQMSEGWPSHVWTGAAVPFDSNWIAGEPRVCVRCLYECVQVCLDLMCSSSSLALYHQSCSSVFKYILYVGVFPCCLHRLRLLFASVHPLDVFLVVWFQLFALEFEGVGDQASLRCPGLGAQADLLGDFKSLQFCWKGQNGKVRSGSLVREGQQSYLQELPQWWHEGPLSPSGSCCRAPPRCPSPPSALPRSLIASG